jgi:hypothetical protein
VVVERVIAWVRAHKPLALFLVLTVWLWGPLVLVVLYPVMFAAGALLWLPVPLRGLVVSAATVAGVVWFVQRERRRDALDVAADAGVGAMLLAAGIVHVALCYVTRVGGTEDSDLFWTGLPVLWVGSLFAGALRGHHRAIRWGALPILPWVAFAFLFGIVFYTDDEGNFAMVWIGMLLTYMVPGIIAAVIGSWLGSLGRRATR